ncbi:putative transcription factor IBH1-like, bHLH domain-containing protein [Helianthus debilis subsp. tardiflorus]
MEAKGGQKQHHSNSGIMKLRRENNTTLKMIKRKRARRAGQEGSRKCTMIEKKVRTLKKLIPNAGSSVGLDGLFRETAEYISNLEMRVKIMQAVVNALSKS